MQKIVEEIAIDENSLSSFCFDAKWSVGSAHPTLYLWEDKISELKYLETKIVLSETWDYDKLAFYNTISFCGCEDLSLQGIDVGNIYSMYQGNWDNYNCKYHRQWIPSKIPGGTASCRDLIDAIELMANENG